MAKILVLLILYVHDHHVQFLHEVHYLLFRWFVMAGIRLQHSFGSLFVVILVVLVGLCLLGSLGKFLSFCILGNSGHPSKLAGFLPSWLLHMHGYFSFLLYGSLFVYGGNPGR